MKRDREEESETTRNRQTRDTDTHVKGDKSGHTVVGSLHPTDEAWAEQMVLWGRTGCDVLDQALRGQLGPVARRENRPHLLISWPGAQ